MSRLFKSASVIGLVIYFGVVHGEKIEQWMDRCYGEIHRVLRSGITIRIEPAKDVDDKKLYD